MFLSHFLCASIPPFFQRSLNLSHPLCASFPPPNELAPSSDFFSHHICRSKRARLPFFLDVNVLGGYPSVHSFPLPQLTQWRKKRPGFDSMPSTWTHQCPRRMPGLVGSLQVSHIANELKSRTRTRGTACRKEWLT